MEKSQRLCLRFTCSRMITSNECRFLQLFASILFLFSLISFVVNLYAIQILRKTSNISIRNRTLIFSIIVSSLCVIVISVPSIVIQLFLFYPISSSWICQIEGFNSFFNGCMSMYSLVALSMVHYISTAHSSCFIALHKRLENHNFLLVIVCLIVSAVWTFPPLFGQFSSYVPEGFGFHCGLNWFDRSFNARIYISLVFIFVYFFPLITVICVNRSIQRTVYRLTHFHATTINLEMNRWMSEERFRRHVSNRFQLEEIRRFQCLYEDRRFLFTSEISLFIYFFAWTPYSIAALAHIFDLELLVRDRWFITACAMWAKLSMIFNPILYTILLKKRQMNIDSSNPTLVYRDLHSQSTSGVAEV